ncbi:OmpA family protein [Rudanella lutea]|uniref:OmpA family protein n=1 Tax=Rudanella lutea TaxID=451374 RepID=UPI00039DF9CB|nr:OmpA family protein [Rudanella lutea]
MNQIGIVGLSLLCTFSLSVARAQVRVNDPKQTVERGVEGRVNGRIDGGINRGLDKVEEGIGNIFKKKEKRPATPPKPANDTNDSAGAPSQDRTGSQRPETAPVSGRGLGTAQTQADEPRSLKAYSKFDFVPGEKVLYFDDFERVSIGDFPENFNSNTSGEVMTLDGQTGKWLGITKNGTIIPENIKSIPDNTTVEFDVAVLGETGCSNDGFGLKFYTDKATAMDYHFGAGAYVTIHSGGCPNVKIIVTKPDDYSTMLLENTLDIRNWDSEKVAVARLSLWRQKGRLRVYVNEEKVADIPRFFVDQKPYMLALFHNFYGENTLLVRNLKIAVGAPDTRSKLITEGKFSTTGILFDVNSDKIRPESYGVLKDIGTVLKENPGVRVKIVGHTDSDGDDAGNVALSKRRAASVKAALTIEFGIEAARLYTDGKGESQPVGPNTTPEGKANNRRVEFLKL